MERITRSVRDFVTPLEPTGSLDASLSFRLDEDAMAQGDAPPRPGPEAPARGSIRNCAARCPSSVAWSGRASPAWCGAAWMC